ncbi:hypothetical protein DF3PA_100007 [Candidatus Defluviicoccus seviourii]|uniref:Uncharacterized protein n=1 Tax=Candidatus Defluviicoccus seviourii TaxID=2565273 RepID=A0A564WCA6_9PROT|nr:hypothetical protein DF3PA_100007 [Candidatus Defluviicoccus seviourii]
MFRGVPAAGMPAVHDRSPQRLMGSWLCAPSLPRPGADALPFCDGGDEQILIQDMEMDIL